VGRPAVPHTVSRPLSWETGARGGGCAFRRPKRQWAAERGSAVLRRPACGPCTRCERRFASPPARWRSWGQRTCQPGLLTTWSATQTYSGPAQARLQGRPWAHAAPHENGTHSPEQAYTATIKREVAPAEPYTNLSQGAWDKRCLRNPTRPYGLVPQPVKQRHRRLAKAPVALHQKRHERIPVERHMRVGRSLLRVPSPYCRSRRCRSCREYVHIPGRAGCAHGQSHRIVEALASLLVCCPRI
jgi:hypothetical protein